MLNNWKNVLLLIITIIVTYETFIIKRFRNLYTLYAYKMIFFLILFCLGLSEWVGELKLPQLQLNYFNLTRIDKTEPFSLTGNLCISKNCTSPLILIHYNQSDIGDLPSHLRNLPIRQYPLSEFLNPGLLHPILHSPRLRLLDNPRFPQIFRFANRGNPLLL